MHAFAKCPFFLQIWHYGSRAGYLGFIFQFGVSQYLQFRSFGLSFGLVPCFPVYVILFTGSSLMSFSRFDIRASGMVVFLFFRLYVFCCICSTIFSTFKIFSFSNLFRNLLSVIDVVSFDKSKSMLNSGKLHSFSNPNTILPVVSRCFGICLFCPKKSTPELYLFLFCKQYL